MRMRRPHSRSLAAALIACMLAAVGAACGGDDASDADPKTVLGEAAAKKIDSAEVRLRTDFNVPGFPILGSRIAIEGHGPFVANGPDALPEFDWNVVMRAGGQTFPARVSGLDGKFYVEFMGQFYEADPDQLEQLGLDGGAGKPQPTSLAQFGIDPDGWLTNVKVSDGDDIGGDSTKVVTGTVNKQAVVEDLLELAPADALGELGGDIEGVPEASDENIDKAVKAIDSAKVEVNVDDDGYPRRVYAKLRFTVPKDVKDTAIKSGTIVFDLMLEQIGDVTVNVKPPFKPDPLSNLLDFARTIFGIEKASDLWTTPN
jgi:hypothetical protein